MKRRQFIKASSALALVSGSGAWSRYAASSVMPFQSTCFTWHLYPGLRASAVCLTSIPQSGAYQLWVNRMQTEKSVEELARIEFSEAPSFDADIFVVAASVLETSAWHRAIDLCRRAKSAGALTVLVTPNQGMNPPLSEHVENTFIDQLVWTHQWEPHLTLVQVVDTLVRGLGPPVSVIGVDFADINCLLAHSRHSYFVWGYAHGTDRSTLAAMGALDQVRGILTAYPDAVKAALISVNTDYQFKIRELCNVADTIRNALPADCTWILKHELHSELYPFFGVHLLLVGELQGRIPPWLDLEREASLEDA